MGLGEYQSAIALSFTFGSLSYFHFARPKQLSTRAIFDGTFVAQSSPQTHKAPFDAQSFLGHTKPPLTHKAPL